MQRWQRIISALWTRNNTVHFLGGVKSGVKWPLKSPANGRCCLKFVENIYTVQNPKIIDKQRKSRSFNNYGISLFMVREAGLEPVKYQLKVLINQGFYADVVRIVVNFQLKNAFIRSISRFSSAAASLT